MATETVSSIVAQALRELNVIGETQEPSAEQGRIGRKKLNAMMELWRLDYGVNIGWYETDSATDTAEVPLYAYIALYSNLAGYLASQYGAQMSAELAEVANSSRESLIGIELRNELDNTDMTHLPEGSGHHGARYDIYQDR